MLRLDISDKTRERFDNIAQKEAEDLGDLGEGSITRGGGNYAGIFGELLFVEVFGGERANTYNYDIIYEGVKVDVKTKRRSVAPEPYYECSIADYNTEQECDYYYFVSVLDNYEHAWMLGCYEKGQYMHDATFHKKGEIDGDNDYMFKADCWNLPISELNEFNGS